MAFAEKVAQAGVTREGGWLYYINKDGNIARDRMIRGGQKRVKNAKPEVVAYTDVVRDERYIYFMDDMGDVSRVPRSINSQRRAKNVAKPVSKIEPVVHKSRRTKSLRLTKTQVAEAVDSEGLAYFIESYCNPADIKDLTLRAAFEQARAALKNFKSLLPKVSE